MAKIRLDLLMVQRGLAESRTRAQTLILAGSVRVDGALLTRPAATVDPSCEIALDAPLPYASRGGYKLAHALDTFPVSPAGRVALDVGASTGGFTDVLLQRGAVRVYAVDVGYGLLDWRLRQDPRVVAVERTNIRYLDALPPDRETGRPADRETGDLLSDRSLSLPLPVSLSPPQAECATIDVSFISLRLVLPAVQRLLTPDAWVIALVKPQFEAGPEQVGKGGVVRDAAVHRAVLCEILGAAAVLGLPAHGLTRSPITGPAGNVEFLAWLQAGASNLDGEQAIAAVVRVR